MSATKKAKQKTLARKPTQPARKKAAAKKRPPARKAAAKKPAAKPPAAKRPAKKPAAAKPAKAPKPTKPAAAAVPARPTPAPGANSTVKGRPGLLGGFAGADADVLQEHVRLAFIPKAASGTTSGPSTRIGGTPWLPEGLTWPICPNCKKPMAFIMQLDLKALPQGAPYFGDGLAQLFYCLNTDPEICEVDCEAFFPFAKSVVARVVSKTAAGADSPLLDAPNAPPPKTITGWEARQDLPNSEELGDLGVKVDYDGALYQALEKAKVPSAGDKLGGWPHWVQGVEYPKCPTCKKSMRLVFQIDSSDVVGPQWGDMGCAHLTQCETHQEQLAFGWACG